MGTYLNPGKLRFQMAVNSEIFVDKTPMIRNLNAVINTNQRYVSISRPRRFGKTLAADMLCAYYDTEAEGRELFERLALATDEAADSHYSWDAHLGKYDVIRIVMTDFIKENVPVSESLDKLQKVILRELIKKFPDVDYFDKNDFLQTLNDVCAEKNIQFVIILDEWDAVFRDRKEDDAGQKQYLDFLRDWLKDKSYVALAYMTGILPIKKYGKHSALNMFDEYSIIAPMQFAPYTGFTEAEVRELCNKFNMSYDDISDWYDGYRVSDTVPVGMRGQYRLGEYKDNIISIYSPLSVVKAVSTGVIQNYWNKTETYEALAEYIRMNFDGLKDAVALMMDGARIPVDLSTYQNDMTSFHGRDDVLTLLINLGYLGYDLESGEAFIPNKEILDEFKSSTKSEEWVETFASFKKSQALLAATWEKDTDKVAELLEYFHDNAGNRTYNSEAALSYAIQMAYYAAQKYYTTILELDTGKGYADVVYLPSPKYPDKPAMLIELKYEKNVKTAADQIRGRNYPQRLEHYKDHLLLISIDYRKEIDSHTEGFKHHSCMIDEY